MAVIQGLNASKLQYLHETGKATAKVAKSLSSKLEQTESFDEQALLLAKFEPTARVAKSTFNLGAESGGGLDLSGGYSDPEIIDIETLKSAKGD